MRSSVDNRFTRPVLFWLLLGCGIVIPAAAAVSDWVDVLGNQFRAEPTDILGPFAVFRTSTGSGKRILFRGLPPAQCERLFRELSGKPPLATRWSEAQARATKELNGRISQVEHGQLQPVSCADRPEPEMLLVLSGGGYAGEAWSMVENMKPLFQRLNRVFPGRVATVFIGTGQDEPGFQDFVTKARMPWFVADYRTRVDLGSITRYLAPDGPGLLLLTRDGTPLLATAVSDFASIRKFTDDLLDLLWAIDPENALNWPDRARYLSIVRPLEYADRSAAPLLIGNPLLIDGLRRRNIQRISAHVEVTSEGAVTAVSLQPNAIVPPAVAPSLVAALRQYLQYLPAIDHGKPVAGMADYVLAIPSVKPALAADAAWLGRARTDVPIAHWLVLRPIHVPEGEFGEIDHVDANTVVMKAVEVSKDRISRSVQLNAFNSDWFGPDGAGTVHPAEGELQTVDGARLTWRKVTPVDGFVDLAAGMGNSDFCVGYAWTEVEVPADTDAWLGVGSDDGLKIWHNGTLVIDRWVRRQSRIDDDVVPLRLKKGKNQLLIKIQNMTIDWSFIARLRTQ